MEKVKEIQYWEDKIAEVRNNPVKAINEFIKEKISLLKDKLVDCQDFDEVIRIQEAIKVYQSLIDLPVKLLEIYKHNLEKLQKNK